MRRLIVNENDSIHIAVTGATASGMVWLAALTVIADGTSDLDLSQGNPKPKMLGQICDFVVVTISTRRMSQDWMSFDGNTVI